MAPFLPATFEPSLGQLEEREFLNNYTLPSPKFTSHKQMNLQVIAAVFSSISVSSAILSFYWFVQMRRSFRHHLIMLLIQSDMFKALWFLLYPIVDFVKGPQPTSSTFCQINGFFLALGIEASDFAILMIALHTALSIFHPVSVAGEGGLYRYRRVAYTLWMIFPVLMASLAFINGSSYRAQGTYCYLPIRPFWYRLALAWIPRYTVFVSILLIYAAIYFYVSYKFDRWDRFSGGVRTITTSSPKVEQEPSARHVSKVSMSGSHSMRAPPTLALHGLIPDSRPASVWEYKIKASISTTHSGVTYPSRSNSQHSVSLINPSSMAYAGPQIFNPPLDHLQSPSQGFACAGSSCNSSSPGADVATPPLAITTNFPESQDNVRFKMQDPEDPVSPFSTASTVVTRPGASFQPFPQPPLPNSKHSPTTKFSAIIPDYHLNKRRRSNESSSPQKSAFSEMVRTREKVQKQLKYMFIYPLAYIAMWIVPFINHALQYNDKLAADPPFALSCAAVVCVTLQCAVDCWLFSTREKPWKQMPSNPRGTFWGSFIFWGKKRRRNFSNRNTISKGPGRSKAEAVFDARMAYKRREEEAEAWKMNDLERKRMRVETGHGGINEARDATQRNWWDILSDGTTLSPVNPAMDPVVEERGLMVDTSDEQNSPDYDNTPDSADTLYSSSWIPPKEGEPQTIPQAFLSGDW